MELTEWPERQRELSERDVILLYLKVGSQHNNDFWRLARSHLEFNVSREIRFQNKGHLPLMTTSLQPLQTILTVDQGKEQYNR